MQVQFYEQKGAAAQGLRVPLGELFQVDTAVETGAIRDGVVVPTP